MAQVPHKRDRLVAGSGTAVEPACRRGHGTARRIDWIGSRNTAAQVVSTSRRRRFAALDTYLDLYVDTNARRPTDQHGVLAEPARVRHAQPPTYVEMGNGLAFAAGLILTSVSILALAAICGWAFLAGP